MNLTGEEEKENLNFAMDGKFLKGACMIGVMFNVALSSHLAGW